jgi:hypothetical protein
MAGELELLQELKEGETVIIQRDVDGKNVIMVVVVRDPCTLTPDRIVLTGRLGTWGTSSYADGRVARQYASINRLLEEREALLLLIGEARALLNQACWHQTPGDVEDSARAWIDRVDSADTGSVLRETLRELAGLLRDKIETTRSGKQPWIPGINFADGKLIAAMQKAETYLRVGPVADDEDPYQSQGVTAAQLVEKVSATIADQPHVS